MAHQQIKSALLACFNKRIGQVVTLDELAIELPQLSKTQIQTNINNMRNSSTEPGGIDFKQSIQVVSRGNAWMFRPTHATLPPAKPTKRCFEEVGTTKDGSLLIQADDGSIWKAVEL